MRKISSKKDLKEFLKKELGVNSLSYFERFLKLGELWIRGSESLPTWTLIYALRHYEYYKNKKSLSWFDYICKQYWRFKLRQIQIRYNMYIEPNVKHWVEVDTSRI